MGVLEFFGLLFLIALVALFIFWAREVGRPLHLSRFHQNPILSPVPSHWWESQAVFNPGALVWDGRVHLFYRALGHDGISRIGYASSPDGIHFDERLTYPVYEPGPQHYPASRTLSYATLTYNTNLYASGGGWGGSEDPRAVSIDDDLYMTFTTFESWNSERISLTTLPLSQLRSKNFAWSKSSFLSAPGEVQKNWVLFPEKIGGKYAVLHNIWPSIEIAYVDSLHALEQEGFINSTFTRSETSDRWDAIMRGAGAPPIKTDEGWLLLYHGMNPHDGGAGYRVGAMLLDLNDPTHVLYRSSEPILVPKEWYENDWKPGVVYASGAVVLNGDLIVYYGGGDKYIAAARHNLHDFLRRLKTGDHAALEPA